VREIHSYCRGAIPVRDLSNPTRQLSTLIKPIYEWNGEDNCLVGPLERLETALGWALTILGTDQVNILKLHDGFYLDLRS
jgi:hypothetical protein